MKHDTDGTGPETDERSFYGFNPHTDVETLTKPNGDTRATYGYTAYGKDDEEAFTGIDKPDAQNPGREPYNVYRFNGKRWDPHSGSYDMGFRDYNPGLNRFLTRDTYTSALADLNLATDPYTGNRYAFAGGNPITRIEIDGHISCTAPDGIDCGMQDRTSWSNFYGDAGSSETAMPVQAERVHADDSDIFADMADALSDAFSFPDYDDYDDFIAGVARDAGIDARLLRGIVQRESHLRGFWFNGLENELYVLDSFGLYSKATIGMTQINEEVFDQTIQKHPEVFRGVDDWGELLGNDKLSIMVTAYHLSDLQRELPLGGGRTTYGDHTREELLAYGYNAGVDNMKDVVRACLVWFFVVGLS
ncbi:RHS repeat-associated core domain-containing protein [Saccharomonospora marina]|uniref:RHS repeat-associated core domain-containing protein n=1 Tax=Saccharomonospora marina TaxID=632569 RepID=UPI0003040E1F|nr:RHS repeat-associated core domain-containing protein [Saccharomonospora marina]